jgi:hypothetical protein
MVTLLVVALDIHMVLDIHHSLTQWSTQLATAKTLAQSQLVTVILMKGMNSGKFVY